MPISASSPSDGAPSPAACSSTGADSGCGPAPRRREGAEHARPADPERPRAARRPRRPPTTSSAPSAIGPSTRSGARHAPPARRERKTCGAPSTRRRHTSAPVPSRATSRSSTLDDVGARAVHRLGREPARVRRAGRQPRARARAIRRAGAGRRMRTTGSGCNRCRSGKVTAPVRRLAAGPAGRLRPHGRWTAISSSGARSGGGLVAPRLPEVDQAEHALAVRDPAGGAALGRPQHAGRAPVAAEPAGVGGQQHDVDGAGAGREVLLGGHGIRVLHDGGRDERRRAVELGGGLRARRLLEPRERVRARGRGSATGS